MSGSVIKALLAVEISEEDLDRVVGGQECDRCTDPGDGSGGWVCTISGECADNGSCCNPFGCS